MTVKPISPREIPELHRKSFPPEVIEAWNNQIVENWVPAEKSSFVLQDDIIIRLMGVMNCQDRSEVFERGWLEIEDIFREQGWSVIYDKPAYFENYRASFKFKPKDQ